MTDKCILHPVGDASISAQRTALRDADVDMARSSTERTSPMGGVSKMWVIRKKCSFFFYPFRDSMLVEKGIHHPGRAVGTQSGGSVYFDRLNNHLRHARDRAIPFYQYLVPKGT